ncbi:MAG: hypothetical protein KY476_00490 [Planctomycetes bacterium]|nr:hypothetical protein [Planctomycetota bacterium]
MFSFSTYRDHQGELRVFADIPVSATRSELLQTVAGFLAAGLECHVEDWDQQTLLGMAHRRDPRDKTYAPELLAAAAEYVDRLFPELAAELVNAP